MTRSNAALVALVVGYGLMIAGHFVDNAWTGVIGPVVAGLGVWVYSVSPRGGER